MTITTAISSETRILGKNALSTILNNQNNIKIIEKYTFKLSNKNILEYKQIIMEIIIRIREGYKLKEIVNLLSNRFTILYDSEDFDNIDNKISERDDFINNPYTIDDGVLECEKCGSKKTVSTTKQTRSGDEATSVFAMCIKCGNKWKM